MASRKHTLVFAVSGSLLALAPVDACAPFVSDPDLQRHPDGDPVDTVDRIRARDGGPVVNPGPTPSGDEP